MHTWNPWIQVYGFVNFNEKLNLVLVGLLIRLSSLKKCCVILGKCCHVLWSTKKGFKLWALFSHL